MKMFELLKQEKNCLHCNGNGFILTPFKVTCLKCIGTGKCIDQINFLPESDNQKMLNRYYSNL